MTQGKLSDKIIRREMLNFTGITHQKDGRNLFLRVSSTDAASWIYRYKVGGIEKRMGFGSYPATTIGLARQKRDAASLARAQGADPAAEKRLSKRHGVTFEAAAREYFVLHCQGLSKPSNWIAAMENHVFPRIGRRQVTSLTPDDVIHVLRPVWGRHSGKKIVQWIGKVILFVGTDDPGVDLDLVKKARNRLGPMSLPKAHVSALPWAQAPAIWSSIPRNTVAGLSLRLAILTAVREDAVIRSDWSEVDLKRGVWSIPEARAKSWDTGFDVPITDDVRAIFEAAKRLFGSTGPVFPSNTKSGFISANTHRNWIQDNGWKDETGKPATAHGLRTTFRTWAQDNLRGDPALYEHILMHVTAKGGEVTKAYARSGRFEERREVMEVWAAYVRSDERERMIEDHARREYRRNMESIIAVEEGRTPLENDGLSGPYVDGLEGE